MKYISAEKEIQLLRRLKGFDFIGAGGARMVFEVDDFMKKLLELDNDKDYVIKVAMGQGGMLQNMAEVNAYNEWSNYNFLAKIYQAGRYCLIMEAVETDDYSDLADGIYSFDTRYEGADDYAECYDVELTDRDNKAVDTIGRLADIFGCTTDNGQIGWTKDGDCVAYDYGFYSEKGCDSQTSPLRDICYNEAIRNDYLSGLICILFEEGALLKAFDEEIDQSLQALERETINDYYRSDEESYEEA